MATHATTWFGILSLASAALSTGYAVVKNGSEYLVATAANRASYGRSVGIAITAASSTNRSFEYQVAGVLSANMSGVGTGTAGDFVIVSATGTLSRVASPGASDDIIGLCPGTSGDVVVAPCRPGPSSGTVPTGTGFRRVVAGVEDAAASAMNLAGGATHVIGTLPADQGGAMSRSTITFADANQTIASGDAAFDSFVIRLAGSNTVTRDLIMPLPARAAASYVRVFEMGVTGGAVRLTMGAGSTWTLSPASGYALHVAIFTPDGVTVWGPAGTPAQLGIQYVQSSGYMGAVPIGTAGQVLKVNGTATGYEFGAASSGPSFADNVFRVTDNADATKQLAFECSGITTGTTRTLTVPDANDTIAVLAATQTLTNKTVSGPSFAASSFLSAGAAPSVVGSVRLDGAANRQWLTFKYADAADYDLCQLVGTAVRWGNSTFTNRLTGAGVELFAPGGQVQVYNSAGTDFILSTSVSNLTLHGNGTTYGGGAKVTLVTNATTNPTTNPTGGGILYADAGAGKWRGSSGTVTTFGPADLDGFKATAGEGHCPSCGTDFALEWANDAYGSLTVCMRCLTDALGDQPWIVRKPKKVA